MDEITLYQSEWCPYSHRVRHLLTTHGVDYRIVNVPPDEYERDALEAATSQRGIPALVIGGLVCTEWGDIGRVIADRFPSPREEIARHERQAAPAVAARLDSGNFDELAQELGECFARYGFALAEESVASPGSGRTFALVHDELMERLVDIEPRLRPALPLRVTVHRHANGAVATALLPNRICASFRNADLNRCSRQLQERILEVFEHVGTKSGVA